MEPITSSGEISAIKKKINEVSFLPLSQHGQEFEEINEELARALTTVEGLN
jgi:hypothetical protein